MSEALAITEKIDFRKAVKNPFARIAKAAKDNGGTLPIETSKMLMKEAIAELYESIGQKEDRDKSIAS